MLGASGAVGTETWKTLFSSSKVSHLTFLGRKRIEITNLPNSINLIQHNIDILNPSSYSDYLPEHETAICTFGVGEPSKVSREEYVRIDKDAVLDFAKTCKSQGIRHFLLLGSVGANKKSSSFYLKTKGEIEEGLRALQFDVLSLFRPSMILTPSNRYGKIQAVFLFLWPKISPLFFGGFSSLRGVLVSDLGKAIAQVALTEEITSVPKTTIYQWDEFQELAKIPIV
ncbi:oxidoreductase [Leptospira kobayashii]|uniref:Oxidoreductase n=2 Tax=Leptospira kobayashii TaxID=1917830 RepID=A0ABN6KAM2_9LEPT|nr:oxidoreductase [Leptospira kobayashii]